jgi:MSHA biogenesis protein MshL
MLVVGGLITTINDNSGNKVMWLGDIPGLQKVFGRSGDSSQRQELVILLKPTIQF